MSPDPLPPIFIISLARAKERRADISRRLDAAGVSYEIFDGVDGEALNLAGLGDRLKPDDYRIKYGRGFTRGEIGCYLSHYNLWQKIVDEKIEHAIIFEDDAVWDEDFFETVLNLLKTNHYWELVLLSANDRRADFVLCDVGNRRNLIRHKRRAWGMVAYIIRRSGAEKLLDYCWEIRAGIDALYSEYWKNGVSFYLVTPPAADHSGSTETQVGALYRPRSFTEKIKGSIYRKLDRWEQFVYCRKHPPKMKSTSCKAESQRRPQMTSK